MTPFNRTQEENSKKWAIERICCCNIYYTYISDSNKYQNNLKLVWQSSNVTFIVSWLPEMTFPSSQTRHTQHQHDFYCTPRFCTYVIKASTIFSTNRLKDHGPQKLGQMTARYIYTESTNIFINTTSRKYTRRYVLHTYINLKPKQIEIL